MSIGGKTAKLLIGLSLPFLLLAQTERWLYRHNGPGNNHDRALVVVYGLNGNIYAGGISYRFNDDITVISLSSTGNECWVYRRGPGGGDDQANSIVYGLDGNIYVAGVNWTTATYCDFTVISLNDTGGERWAYFYDGVGNKDDEAYSIVYGSDGNIYAAGYSAGIGSGDDFTVISLTSDGNERWVYRYDGPGGGDDRANSIVYGSDGNIYAGGKSWGSSDDLIVISLTSNGNERWVYRYDGPGNNWDEAYSLVYGSDGNIYAAGYSYDSITSGDFVVICLTNTGNERWVYRYNGPGNFYDEANTIVYGLDGNIYAGGASNGYLDDITVISLTSDGNERWVYRYDGPGSGGDKAYSLVYGLDGNIYVAGYSYGSTIYDFTIISLTDSGNERWVYRYDGPANNWDEAYSIVYGSDGNIYAAGYSTGIGSGDDFTVISLATVGVSEEDAPFASKLRIGPNPTRGKFTLNFALENPSRVKVTLFDLSGRMISTLHDEKLTSSKQKLTLTFPEKFSSGIYFLMIETAHRCTSRKVVLNR